MADIFDEIVASAVDDGGTVTVAPFNDMYDQIANEAVSAKPSFDELLGNPQTPIERAARVGVGGASRVLPFGDEIVAGGSALVDALRGAPLSGAFDSRLNEVRNYQDAFSQAPGGSIAAPVVDIAGALALPFKSKVPSLTGSAKLIQAAKEGSAISALFGFAGGEGIVDRLQGGAKDAALGALFSAGGTKALDFLSDIFSKAGGQFSRKSVGASYADYLKTADEAQNLALTDDIITSKTQAYLDDLIDSGALGASRNPAKLVSVSNNTQAELAKKIGSVIGAADEAKTAPVLPTFDNALEYLQSGKVPADQVERYINRLSSLGEGIAREGGGSLSYLQQQKIAIGKSYDPKDGVLNGFNRALYTDLQKTIERAAPDVIPLNQELAKWQTLEPILKRTLARSESTDPVTRLMAFTRTSGGFGTPMLAASTGGAIAGPVGAVVAGVGGALTTAKGQQVAGAALKSASETLRSSPVSQMVPGILSSTRSAQRIGDQAAPATAEAPQLGESPKIDSKRVESAVRLLKKESAKVPRPKQQASLEDVEKYPSSNNTADRTSDLVDLFSKPAVTKKDIAAVERAIDSDPYDAAVYEMESSRNPKAKNPNSSASGAFQLISKTQKSLGVKNPFDIAENYQGFLKLKKEHVDRFGDDPRILYAAHFLGATTLSKFLKGETLTEKQAAQVKELEKIALPRFMKIYSRISGGGVEV